MKITILFLCLLLTGCKSIKINKNWYKEGDVKSYYKEVLIGQLPVKMYYKLNQAYEELRDINDAEMNGRILFSPHDTFKNVYTIRWFTKNNEIIKEFTIELYKPIEDPKSQLNKELPKGQNEDWIKLD